MKNSKVIEIYQALLKMNYEGVKFSYFVAKNLALLGSEIDIMQKTAEVSKEFNEYDQKRATLAEKYSKKDKEGKPVIVNNVYQMDDQAGFDKEFEKLKKENKDVISVREKQIEDYVKFLEEESKVTPFKIKQENLPSNIKTVDLRAIFDIIEE